MDKMRTPESLPNIEKESQPNRVVRVFLSQSRSMEDITSRIKEMKQTYTKMEKSFDYSQLYFTTIIWAEKNNKSLQNAGQLMPVGGNMESFDKNETAAAMREVLEETHLRVLDLEKFDTAITYTLKRQTGDDKHIQQELFFGNILPTDTAYSINPQEDKIKTFHPLDLKDMGALYADKDLQIYDDSISLLGNLRLPLSSIKKDAKIVRSSEDEDNSKKVFFELAEKAQKREREKRESIMKKVYAYVSEIKEIPEVKNMMDELLLAPNFFEHQKAFQNICVALENYYGDDFIEALQTSIEASNFEEEILVPESKESYMEAVMQFIYILLETKSDYDLFLDIAKNNKKLLPFVKKLESFLHALTNEHDTSADHSHKKRDLKHKLRVLGELDDELIVDAFCEAFEIDEQSVNIRLSYINAFLKDLSSRAFLSYVSEQERVYSTDIIDTTNEITQATVAQLVKYAFPFGDDSWKERFSENSNAYEEKKRQVFEARRQLALLYLFIRSDEHYDRTITAGNAPIAHVWDIMTPPMYPVTLKTQYTPEGDVSDIIIKNDRDDNDDKETPITLRKLSLKPQLPSFLVHTDVREKERSSLYRKMIERGFDDPEQAKDIYGRSIILVTDESSSGSYDYIRRRETKSIRIDGELRECEDIAPLLDMMEYMSTQEGVTIVQYTPTPREGEAFASKGIGGGSKIRLGKFYIKHTDEKGVVRYEEVQVFTPSPQKSAFFWYEQKKHDDKEYFLDRLMKTKGFHSVLELLYPTAIYGDAMNGLRNAHTKRKKNGNK